MFLRVCVVLTLLALPAPAQDLRQRLAELSKTAAGKVAIACSLPGTTLNCDLNPESKPPMQSVFKLPLAMAALHLVEQKKLSLNQPIRFQPSDRIPKAYSPLQDKYPHADVDIPLRELLEMAVSLSDNVAADMVLRTIGGPSVVNDYIKSLGIIGFHLEDSEAALHRDEALQYRDWFEPQSAVQLLRYIADHPSELIQAWLRDTTRGPNRIKGLLPAGTLVMHKPGTSDAATNDIGLIRMPNGKYLAIAIFVTDSKADEATRDLIIAKIAFAAYKAALN